ncbi:uncharacterized protein LOC117329467 [Pecten maximus]|uniref:uncharacterized protein LOC117329467 n=1 Tax=Pecten maximus TaxID=6579 RepID=UPI001458AE6E|nr:uncharacterized protein LOC117329467 [Pecten maximus]XP_033743313.1 uncharacterized protein LOC117329467 [Pecten maximus]
MFGDSDGQDEYMVQQKVSYRMYEQEQKVLLRSRYPFLSPVQISRKVKESWNRLKQEAKLSYTKSVLVKTPSKEQTKGTTKSKPKKHNVRAMVDEETCDLIGYETVDLPIQKASPVYGQPKKNDSVYTSDFYSSPMVSPNNDNSQDTFCPKLFESPNFESPPHRQFDIFNQKNYTKSKLPLKVPKITQSEHSTQGILKGRRTDETPKTKAGKGRVSFSTDGNDNYQQSQDCSDADDCNQDDDSEDDYNAMLIRRTDDSFDFDDIDQHHMFVEEKKQQGQINTHPVFNKEKKMHREVLKCDKSLHNKERLRIYKKIDGGQENEYQRESSFKEAEEGKKILKPATFGNTTRGKKRKECSGKEGERQVNYGDETVKDENLAGKPKRKSRKMRKQDISDGKGDNHTYYSLFENSLSKGNDSSQSNDSAHGNSQSNDSAHGNSQSNDSANGNSQSNDSVNSQPYRKSYYLTKKEMTLGLKPSLTEQGGDITPVVQTGEKTYITPQMDDDVYTHNLLEASKLPRKARRSSMWKENFQMPPDNCIDQSSKLTKQKRRSSRNLAGEEKAYTEVKKSHDTVDRFMKCEQKGESVLSPLVDASGDAKEPDCSSVFRRTLRSQTKLAIQSENYDHNDSTKLSDLSSSDSWTILDEEYNADDLSEGESDSHPIDQSDASHALMQALRKMKQVVADEEISDERSSPKLLSPALSGISQMSSVSSNSSATNSQSSPGTGHIIQGHVSSDKAVSQGLCEMFGDMTPPEKRTSQHTRRLLASSNRESSSNFSQLFKTKDIFY